MVSTFHYNDVITQPTPMELQLSNGSFAAHQQQQQQQQQPAGLPLELVLQVLDAVLPSNQAALVPASHTSTQTLLAFTRVCRGTYRPATRLLRTRCMHVESSQRLAKLLHCLTRFVPSLPPPLSLKNITNLYLAPFKKQSLDDLPTAVWVRELFCEVCDSLRRLVVEMPFGSLDLLDDHLNVRRTLRDGFQQLVHLEEFVALGDYPALSLSDGPTDVWRLWPNLKRLGLFGVPLDNHWLWWDIATLPSLQHVVLACPMVLEYANIKHQYFHTLPRDDPALKREIKVLLIDAAYELLDVKTAGWKRMDPEGRMTIETYEVPIPFYDDESELELVTSWVRRGSLDGKLWTWEGRKVEEGQTPLNGGTIS